MNGFLRWYTVVDYDIRSFIEISAQFKVHLQFKTYIFIIIHLSPILQLCTVIYSSHLMYSFILSEEVEYPEKTHADTGRTPVTMLTTTAPCCHNTVLHNYSFLNPYYYYFQILIFQTTKTPTCLATMQNTFGLDWGVSCVFCCHFRIN